MIDVASRDEAIIQFQNFLRAVTCPVMTKPLFQWFLAVYWGYTHTWWGVGISENRRWKHACYYSMSPTLSAGGKFRQEKLMWAEGAGTGFWKEV